VNELRDQIVTAIQTIKTDLRWKPGSAARHLLKRKLRGHLPAEATLKDYEHIIQAVLDDPEATVCVYRHKDVPYIAVVATIQDNYWLVMFTLGGLMESAFVVEHPNYYLNKPAFERVGSLNEVLR
jgi:esterase/lipase superfamily enzyme